MAMRTVKKYHKEHHKTAFFEPDTQIFFGCIFTFTLALHNDKVLVSYRNFHLLHNDNVCPPSVHFPLYCSTNFDQFWHTATLCQVFDFSLRLNVSGFLRWFDWFVVLGQPFNIYRLFRVGSLDPTWTEAHLMAT